MDLMNIGGKILQSVRSAKSFGITPFTPEKPEVPLRVAAAAAVARSIAGVPPHQRLNIPSSEGSSSIYGGRSIGNKVEELDGQFYEQVSPKCV
ncbi:hypothetical protein KP509_1Z249300 [Ceratopteris richardii]|nr:hypothetical protein KP509_1Z249300 [Ceratopteris richardii]